MVHMHVYSREYDVVILELSDAFNDNSFELDLSEIQELIAMLQAVVTSMTEG